MSSCPSRTYPLAAQEACAVCAKIAAGGGPMIDATQATGTTVSHGVTLEWTIAAGTITISIPSKPWVLPCAQIYGELDGLFAAT